MKFTSWSVHETSSLLAQRTKAICVAELLHSARDAPHYSSPMPEQDAAQLILQSVQFAQRKADCLAESRQVQISATKGKCARPKELPVPVRM